jgi:hypothetical protein
MELSKTEMINDVVAIFGHEAEWTIWFTQMTEILNGEQLDMAYHAVRAVAMVPEQDEDEMFSWNEDEGFDPYEGAYTFDC